MCQYIYHCLPQNEHSTARVLSHATKTTQESAAGTATANVVSSLRQSTSSIRKYAHRYSLPSVYSSCYQQKHLSLLRQLQRTLAFAAMIGRWGAGGGISSKFGSLYRGFLSILLAVCNGVSKSSCRYSRLLSILLIFNVLIVVIDGHSSHTAHPAQTHNCQHYHPKAHEVRRNRDVIPNQPTTHTHTCMRYMYG